eukprot:2694254-Pleurochrysis_carterae.AAC.1
MPTPRPAAPSTPATTSAPPFALIMETTPPDSDTSQRQSDSLQQPFKRTLTSTLRQAEMGP